MLQKQEQEQEQEQESRSIHRPGECWIRALLPRQLLLCEQDLLCRLPRRTAATATWRAGLLGAQHLLQVRRRRQVVSVLVPWRKLHRTVEVEAHSVAGHTWLRKKWIILLLLLRLILNFLIACIAPIVPVPVSVPVPAEQFTMCNTVCLVVRKSTKKVPRTNQTHPCLTFFSLSSIGPW